MFSKSKITEGAEPGKAEDANAAPRPFGLSGGVGRSGAKPAPSIISADLVIRGNLETDGDMQIEGTVIGDIRSHLLTIGPKAKIEGEVIADDVVVNGHVVGRIRGQKVRLSSSAHVDGDIVHKNIAIDSGATFEGSVQRSDDPLGQPPAPRRAPSFAAAPTRPAPGPTPAGAIASNGHDAGGPSPSVSALTIGDSSTTTPKLTQN